MKCQFVGAGPGAVLAVLLALSAVGTGAFRSYCPHRCICDDDVLHSTCDEGDLDVIPIALNPSLSRLVIKFNQIKYLDSAIQFYPVLTMLDLSYNHLLSIEDLIFMYSGRMLQLHLNNNKLGEITNKTFHGLSELQVLNLRANFLDEIGPDVFSGMPKLQELNLGQNRIATLHASAFEGLANLRVLYLDDNSISTVPTVALTPLKGLAELYLGTNSLNTVLPGAFEGMAELRLLNIRGSMLVNITGDTFRGLENIRTLDISDNHLLKVPTVQLSSLKRLEDLTIGQNDFEVIPEGAFFGLSNLKAVDISGALNLRQVQSGAFSANTNLESITIASNKELQELDEGAFSGLPHVRKVSLRDNKIGTFHEELLPWKHLVEFDLTDNPLVCDCNVLWLRNLLQRQNPETQETAQIVCTGPDRLHGEPLRDLTVDMLGCQHLQSKERAIVGAIIVALAAIITTLVLIVYRLRHRILSAVRRTGWGAHNKRDTLQEEKDVEVQKTLGEVEYHQPHCNIYTYNYHPAYRNYQHPFGGQHTLPYPHYQTHAAALRGQATLQHHPHHQQQQQQPHLKSSPAASSSSPPTSIVAVAGGLPQVPLQQSAHQLQQQYHQQPPLPQTPKGPLGTPFASTASSSTSSSALSSSGSTVSAMSAQTQSSTIYSPQYAHHIYEEPKNVADT